MVLPIDVDVGMGWAGRWAVSAKVEDAVLFINLVEVAVGALRELLTTAERPSSPSARLYT